MIEFDPRDSWMYGLVGIAGGFLAASYLQAPLHGHAAVQILIVFALPLLFGLATGIAWRRICRRVQKSKASMAVLSEWEQAKIWLDQLGLFMMVFSFAVVAMLYYHAITSPHWLGFLIHIAVAGLIIGNNIISVLPKNRYTIPPVHKALMAVFLLWSKLIVYLKTKNNALLSTAVTMITLVVSTISIAAVITMINMRIMTPWSAVVLYISLLMASIIWAALICGVTGESIFIRRPELFIELARYKAEVQAELDEDDLVPVGRLNAIRARQVRAGRFEAFLKAIKRA